ncbi:MAG: AmmeMemoRadiSam system protein B [Nitrososphaerota archaeon]
MPRRTPAVAGTFYPSSSTVLKKQIEECFLHSLGPGRLSSKTADKEKHPLALISPHAGYVYSGPIAAHGYLELDGRAKPDTVIVIGPNHYGFGTSVSIYPEGTWVTPLGEVKVNSEIGKKLAEISEVFSLDELSHLREHSIEVQIPFLQYVLGSFSLVPICMLDQSIEAALEVGKAIAELLSQKSGILLIASTDFSHYEPHEVAVRKDSIALDKIMKLEVETLYRVLREKDISMCGYGPVAAVLEAARRIQARGAELLRYATSGDVTGDKSSVVGYASLKIEYP